MKVHMIYWRLSGFDGDDTFVGGVETYLFQLAELCVELNMEPILYQCATKYFERRIGPLKVVGVATPGVNNSGKSRKALYRAATLELDHMKDILLYAADQWSVRTNYPRTILIQHGIGWDKPIQFMTQKKLCYKVRRLEHLKRMIERRRWLKSFENCNNRVCVDYNFLNWYRTFNTCDNTSRIWVIPNSAPLISREKINEKLNRRAQSLNILFARRFESFRGSRLMAMVAQRIIQKIPNVMFTFAGDGTDSDWLQGMFKDEKQVTICKVPYDKRMELNYDHDIAVIPSYGSEGTSLSVAEAMGAGCAVIATNSGGITNMILSGFNGHLISPDPIELEEVLIRLINNHEHRRQLAYSAYEVAEQAFSHEIWKKKWAQVLCTVAKQV